MGDDEHNSTYNMEKNNKNKIYKKETLQTENNWKNILIRRKKYIYKHTHM